MACFPQETLELNNPFDLKHLFLCTASANSGTVTCNFESLLGLGILEHEKHRKFKPFFVSVNKCSDCFLHVIQIVA